MRRFLGLLILVAFFALSATTPARAEPDSSTTTTAGCAPAITVAASGLTGRFTATCVPAACTWDYGDSGTGEGNPVDHTYPAGGEYTVTATCGNTVISRTFTPVADPSFTGFGLVPFGVAIAALVLLSAGALWFTRRARVRS